jgi:hypothetical protein
MRSSGASAAAASEDICCYFPKMKTSLGKTGVPEEGERLQTPGLKRIGVKESGRIQAISRPGVPRCHPWLHPSWPPSWSLLRHLGCCMKPVASSYSKHFPHFTCFLGSKR